MVQHNCKVYKEQKQYGNPVNKQCCRSRSPILIFNHPGSLISDPRSKNSKKGGWKKISCHALFTSYKFNKIKNYFIFEMLKKKKLDQFSKNYRTFCPKNWHKALKNMGLGSGIRKKPIPDPGSRGQKGIGSGSATLWTNMAQGAVERG